LFTREKLILKMISNNLISLRALEPSDLDCMYRWENNFEEWKFSDHQIPFSKFILEKYIQQATDSIYSSKQLRLVIEEKCSGKCLGFLDFFDFDPQNARMAIGIIIGEKKDRRKGFALEALNLGKSFVKSSFGLRQLYCHISENNPASISLFEKAGFTQSGCLKDWKIDRKNWINVLVFQCLLKD